MRGSFISTCLWIDWKLQVISDDDCGPAEIYSDEPRGQVTLVKPMPKKKSEHWRPLALEPSVAHGLLSRLRFTRLRERFPGRPMWALFMFVNGFVTIAILAGVAMVSHSPFVFPWADSHSALLHTPISNGFSAPYNLRTRYWHSLWLRIITLDGAASRASGYCRGC